MLRKTAIGLFMASLVVAGIIAVRGDTIRAEAGPTARLQPEEGQNGNNALKPAIKLPVTQVVLFNSGVGYFNRSGEVDGDARVDLQFSAGDINDLIKSLVIHDAKGKTLPLRYDSQEPIEKTLKSFAIDLSTNPSFGQILNQMRGQKVEITLQTTNPNLSGLPATMTGSILGMETTHRPPSPTATAAAEMELLNLSCAEGLRSVPLLAVQRVRFLNPTVENELRRALDVVAVGHDSLKKTVHLGFKAEGKRDVSVGYVVENPIWKTSYRLVKNEAGKWRIQAWANVENTSDEDWNDVKLTLVSSRPISFQMDLYPPLFIPRPTVEPALFASLRPPTYGGPITNAAINLPNFGFQGGVGFGGNVGNLAPGQNGLGINNSGNPMMNQGGFGGGGFGGQGGGFAGQGGFGGQFGMQGGQVNSFNNLNKYQNANYDNNFNGRQTFEQMQNRKLEAGKNDPKGQAKIQAQQLGSALTNVDPDFIERARAADELGQPARFAIDQKVSLPRQQSVMLPILDEEIDAAKVSIYNERVHASRPLHGLRIKNKTKQALMSGPVTVYEGEQPYSGDARLLDLQPNEERYLSYALDTGIEIKPFESVQPGPTMTVKMENGQLNVQYKLLTTRTYAIVNRSPEDRKIVLEQPVRSGWKLVKPEKPLERTADLYRFEVDVKAGETTKFEVSEELPRADPFSLTKQADWTGFATGLGLDVWTDSNRAPEDSFIMQVNNGQLAVTHKDRRTTTYFFKNRADEDRIVVLEHNVIPERVLIGKEEPAEKKVKRHSFKIELKKGETASHTISEELRVAKPEIFAMQAQGRTIVKPGDEEIPANRFVTELGFDVWQTRTVAPEVLVSGQFVKGELRTSAREVETMIYHIRNRAETPRSFVVDHPIRTNWTVPGEIKRPEAANRCFEVSVKVPAASMVRQPVNEERIVPKKETLAEITEERLKALVASTNLKASVKESLQKGYTMRNSLEQVTANLRDLRAQLKEINEEQARLRTNLEKLPAMSELYKRYLTKLDQQETALEKVQSQLTEKVGDEKKQKKEYESFLEKLTIE